MAFDKKTYDAQYHKERTKMKGVRYTLEEVQKVEAYCAYKQEGYSELVKRLIAEEMARDGWTYNDGIDNQV